jgi:hypothetical protein
MAGVSVLESDVIANGCQECPFSATTLRLWSVTVRVDDATTADNVVHAGPAAFVVQSDGHYRQDLDAGLYLLCLDQYCVNVTVLAGHTTPLNVLHPFGPPQFKLFDPLTHAAQAVTTFTVRL